MNIKTILVHVAGDDQAEKRLSVAISLARRFDAHVTAVYIPRHRFEGAFARGASASYREEMARLAGERADAAQEKFAQACERYGLSTHWVNEDGEDHHVLARHARVADLLILSQSRPETVEDFISPQLTEELIMTSGLPALVLPEAWEPQDLGDKILVAWKSTRESVRAVRDALPFLRRAQRVQVLSIGPGDGTEEPDDWGVPAEQARNFIARHGFEVALLRDFDKRGDAGDVILAHAQSQGADLLVMGAYGQPKWREMVLGGATHTVMEKMTIPVLFSH